MLMESFYVTPLPIASDDVPNFHHNHVEDGQCLQSVDDGIASLMKMAESMEELLPPDMSSDFLQPEITEIPYASPVTITRNYSSNALLPDLDTAPHSDHYFCQVSSQSYQLPNQNHEEKDLGEERAGVLDNLCLDLKKMPQGHQGYHGSTFMCEIPTSPPHYTVATNQSLTSSNNASLHERLPDVLRGHSNCFPKNDTYCQQYPASERNTIAPNTFLFPVTPYGNEDSGCGDVVVPVKNDTLQTPCTASEVPFTETEDSYDAHKFAMCLEDLFEKSNAPDVRERANIGKEVKPQKIIRKPKTYAKPVASRFCHICSRMPRKGQGSAICKKIAEGLCRKIVCEHCIREQGWDYDAICKNKGQWICPHCANNCPSRSQCHIYNRINARRKKVTPKSSSRESPFSSSSLSGKTTSGALNTRFTLPQTASHIQLDENIISQNQQKILRPPPNFELRLPFLPYLSM